MWAAKQTNPVLKVHPTAQQMLVSSGLKWTPEQRVALGIGTGVMTGGGVALVVEALRGVLPPVVFGIGCALIGGGLGGAMAGGIIGEFTVDSKTGTVTLKAPTLS